MRFSMSLDLPLPMNSFQRIPFSVVRHTRRHTQVISANFGAFLVSCAEQAYRSLLLLRCSIVALKYTLQLYHRRHRMATLECRHPSDFVL